MSSLHPASLENAGFKIECKGRKVAGTESSAIIWWKEKGLHCILFARPRPTAQSQCSFVQNTLCYRKQTGIATTASMTGTSHRQRGGPTEHCCPIAAAKHGWRWKPQRPAQCRDGLPQMQKAVLGRQASRKWQRQETKPGTRLFTDKSEAAWVHVLSLFGVGMEERVYLAYTFTSVVYLWRKSGQEHKQGRNPEVGVDVEAIVGLLPTVAPSGFLSLTCLCLFFSLFWK